VGYKARGQSLLEVLIAFSVVLIILSAVTTIVLFSLTQVEYSKNVNLATQYAQEGMELSRGRGDFQPNEQFCLNEDGEFDNPNPCSGANIGIFKREVNATGIGCGSRQRVTVTVSWSDGRCGNTPFCHKVPITSCI